LRKFAPLSTDPATKIALIGLYVVGLLMTMAVSKSSRKKATTH